ncbi:MAG: lipopolysaccharide transport periplasmic protein LptA [Azoarcus sp.]|jgi:lipopolysaccharide export system protein LptA|nr:lipopolysaccharide transport periplasmic protein LptA [Azoarcus sp.]
MTRRLAALALISILLQAPAPVHAQSPDRSQPVDIDADKVTVDDRNKVHVFEGNVVLTQGSMTIKGDKIVVTQDTAGFHNGVATAGGGKLVYFRQKRASDGAWIDGEAERIEYNSQHERAKLFNRAQIKNAGDMVRGQYIEYDIAAENYLVTDAPGTRPSRSGESPPGNRVHVTIQPKNNKPDPSADEAR